MGVKGLIGTEKGAFILSSDASRTRWSIDGPLFKGWRVTTAAVTPEGDYLLGTSSNVYGTAIQRSRDLETWEQVKQGPEFGDGSIRRLKNIWTIEVVGDALYAGVDDAGLFYSEDSGDTWDPVPGLNDHSTSKKWSAGAGGLCTHVVLNDSENADRLWCGISAVGTFRSEDGGDTWVPRNDGVEVVALDEEEPKIGFCVHALAQDPDSPERIYRQDHSGVYRTSDGGDTWERIENGLPAVFGFPIEIDPHSKALFVFPQESPEYRMSPNGRFGVYRSEDEGESWHLLANGLPQEGVFTGVLRGAMAIDGLDPAGVYVGSTAGTVHVSADRGDTWETLAATLPRILSVSILDAG